MEIVDRVKRDRLRPPTTRGIINYVLRKLDPKLKIPNVFSQILVTRKCNLNCFSCGVTGKNQDNGITPLENIFYFTRIIDKLFPKSVVMITGGEPTAIPKSILGKICQYIKEAGLSTFLITNGFRYVPFEWFDYIVLDDHGVNRKDLEKWIEVLSDNYTPFEILDKTYHLDLLHAKKGNITKGAKCRDFLDSLVLYKDVIYPCCAMTCVEWYNDTNEVTIALQKNGWSTRNQDFPEVFENWRDTLPSEFYRLCTVGCWRDSQNVKWVKNSNMGII